MCNFRLLKPSDIEVRPAQIRDGKATLLLYIDSRSVVQIMNEAVGAMNWNMEFYEVNGVPVGKLGIWDEGKKTWVYKSDTGSESNIEASKGQFSDIYKRCIARWGVTELYSAPKIVVDDDGYGNKLTVSEISYDNNRNIVHLVLVNKLGKTIFSWDKGQKGIPVPEQTLRPKNEPQNGQNLEILRSFCTQKKNAGENTEELKRFFDYFKNKCEGWKGDFLVDKLWQKWSARTVDVNQQYS